MTPTPTDRPRDWDATTYDRVSDALTRWGSAVVGRLELAGDERVLDAGCGSGRVTEQLLARLPRGRVIALDGSPNMLAEAERRLARGPGRLEFVCADLSQPLRIVPPVDAILSTATFHWVADHDALFANLAAVLRPGGQLVFQCGGYGNIAAVVSALTRVGDGWAGPWTFATAEETAARLERAGFVDVHTWLHDEPVPLEPGEPLETYLSTVVLGAHLDRLPKPEHAAFVKAVASQLPRPVIEYVRLNAVARRA